MSLKAVWPGVCMGEVAKRLFWNRRVLGSPAWPSAPHSPWRPRKDFEPKTDLQKESVVTEDEQLLPGCTSVPWLSLLRYWGFVCTLRNKTQLRNVGPEQRS